MFTTAEKLATLVVCEDDRATREILRENLVADRFEVLSAGAAEEALRYCRVERPDGLLLDIRLPDASGLDVIREIRGTSAGASVYDPDLPILVVSGRAEVADRVRVLRAGADDFLAKPYSYEELHVRLRRLVLGRRVNRPGPIRVESLVLDPTGRSVSVAGREVKLANKEFELLRTLVEEPRRVYTKSELLQRIWGYAPGATTRTLDSHASRLRRKLDPDGARFVWNVWGVGYRLIEG